MMGIDAAIAEMNALFEEQLWPEVAGKKFFGRVFRERDENDNIRPLFFNKGQDYRNVKFDDTTPVTCFYDCGDTVETDQQQHQRDVGIIFVVRLDKIYPSITDYRPEQEVEFDVRQILEQSPAVFNDNGTVYGMPAYNDFATDGLKNVANLHPWFVFRINVKLSYLLNNCN
jgi:hypothetical protein